jgi:hypothetical protein
VNVVKLDTWTSNGQTSTKYEIKLTNHTNVPIKCRVCIPGTSISQFWNMDKDGDCYKLPSWQAQLKAGSTHAFGIVVNGSLGPVQATIT